ncbi:MAG: N-acetyl-gamma-glutamyl-phosphate reductase [Phycisphaeraceae bacterium]|nr:N-acetyl-gamma-glutamyl-phosphate reductase [Phycisphaerales bacterium]MCB9860733.1 N-acetyl-gamma-glutamyl-phosphate reductase [Phycisphaeraceae bacterium]
MSIRCAIVGATGYTGAELVDILLRHPQATLAGVFGSDTNTTSTRTMDSEFPRFRNQCSLSVEPFSVDALKSLHVDAVFLCTPHEASADIVPQLLAEGLKVLDLSGAYRLSDTALYPTYYSFTHTHPDVLKNAVYGMVEINRDTIKNADIVAVPGCYPTSVILPVRPLADAGAIDASAPVIVDAISGISGAGRGAKVANLFCEVSAGAYNVLKHRHQPEMREHAKCNILFIPHIGPYDRGIVSTIHVQLAAGWNENKVRTVLMEKYANEPWVRLLTPGTYPRVNDVARTNYCDIATTSDGSHLVICSAIDNLLKGASGQAVQCMNVRFGFDESAGLIGGAA